MSDPKRIVAVFGQRFEPDWLVEECVKNLEPIVDKIHVIDNTKQRGAWQDEGAYRRQQRVIARKMGGDFFLLTSPDERWELSAAEEVRRTVETSPQLASYTFRVCEMWNPEQYRVDGQFGPQRHRLRLFPVDAMFGPVQHRRIHSPIIRATYKARKKPLESRIYHLKNALPENREKRVEIMKKLDAETGIVRRPGGWDEFIYDSDAVLERIPDDHQFYPPLSQEFRWSPGEDFFR